MRRENPGIRMRESSLPSSNHTVQRTDRKHARKQGHGQCHVDLPLRIRKPRHLLVPMHGRRSTDFSDNLSGCTGNFQESWRKRGREVRYKYFYNRILRQANWKDISEFANETNAQSALKLGIGASSIVYIT
ncbi:hypothetical protein V6Z93_002166 [Aspergillus fumigatus]